jgi:hypothetical protein
MMKIKSILACSLLFLQLTLPVWATENAPLENWKLSASTSTVLLAQERDRSLPLLSLAQTEPLGEFELGTGKSRWLAGGMSLLIPGAGQFYNEDYVFGSVYAALASGLVITLLVAQNMLASTAASGNISSLSGLAAVMGVCNIGLPVVSLASSIHAGVQTSEIQLIRF